MSLVYFLLAGCCDFLTVQLHDNDIILQKDEQPVDGPTRYASQDAQWAISFCEENGMWEIREG